MYKNFIKLIIREQIRRRGRTREENEKRGNKSIVEIGNK